VRQTIKFFYFLEELFENNLIKFFFQNKYFSIWNYPEIKKVLPTAVYITLLRQVYFLIEKIGRASYPSYRGVHRKLILTLQGVQ